jgi:putative SOS response-associated peptidase YedK
MCGRYSLFVPQDTIEERFGATFVDDYEPRYNAAPSQQLPVILDEAPAEIRRARWGLIPAWGGEGDGLINARAETAAEKPAFREAYDSRRCLVPADGFYEWTERDGDGDGGGGKQPYRFTRADEQPFAMAGLYRTWTPETTQTGLGEFGSGGPSTADPVTTFTILTREPNDLLAEYHHRMSVMLSPEEEQAWLEGAPVEEIAPTPSEALRAYPVSTAVNSPANDSPAVVEEIEH